MSDLFDWAESEGHRRKRAGMELAADAEEVSNPGWSLRAFEAIVMVARSQPTVHVDDVLTIFDERPRHFNAWGSVWSKALKRGILEATGTAAPCRYARKHKHVNPVYKSLIFLQRW